jgi:hypothetical protein
MSSSSRVLNFEILGIIDIYIPWKSWKLIILQCSVTSQEDRILIRVCVCEKMYHVFSIAEHNMVFNLHRNLKNKVTFFWGGIYSIMLLPVKQ